MESYDVKTVEEVLKTIDNGEFFESFCNEFLAAYLGKDFNPKGKMHDKGIDGIENLLIPDGKQVKIYQASIQKDGRGKIRNTIRTLITNGVNFDELIYVTNKIFSNSDQFIEEISDEFACSVKIWDLSWLASKVNHNTQTQSVYNSFVSRSLKNTDFEKYFIRTDYSLDPRLYVFLRQQFDENRHDLNIDEIIADSIILYSLEGTDPDQNRYKTESEILASISDFVSSHPKQLEVTILSRLKALSTKPRKIKYHSKFSGYVLPYETRLEMQEKQILDLNLQKHFQETCLEIMNENLKKQDFAIRDSASLVLQVINELYYTQGLEFSNFIINQAGKDQNEKLITDVIDKVIQKLINKSTELTKIQIALLHTIRTIVYQGDPDIREYLRRLSNTYLMMFLVQWDPHVARFFREMSAELEVYVCNSIIIPAISEIFLEDNNRRHTNLLIGAKNAGVKLYVDEFTIEEIVTHLQITKRNYYENYLPKEDLYMDELQMLYIDEILVRAYYYAKIAGKVKDFNDFLNRFIDPDLVKARNQISFWLNDKFGITYRSSKNSGVEIDTEEEEKLVKALTPYKKNNKQKATNDIKTMLTVFALREKNCEVSNGVFGYKTWWLSKDTSTYRVVKEALGEKYDVSCYMRPDFLYQYIALAPTEANIKESYKNLFPSLIGVNIGYHIAPEISSFVKNQIEDFYEKDPTRTKMIMMDLSSKLKYDLAYQSKVTVQHYLDEEKRKLLEEKA